MDIVSAALIAGIILLYSLQTLFCTLYTRRYPGRSELAAPVFCILEAAFIVLITFALRGFSFHPSGITWRLGALNALVLLGYNMSLMAAGKRGSYAFFNMALLYGAILVPIVYSVLFLQESTTLNQWIGAALMLVALGLMNWEGKSGQKPKRGYYLCCAILFLCNGLYSVLLKKQSLAQAEESGEMVMITFGLMGLAAMIHLALQEKGRIGAAFRQNKKSRPPLIACLICAGLAVNGLVFVLPRVNTVVLFTLENGGVLLLSSLYALLLFHEKAAFPKIAGIFAAVVSMTLLSL